MQTTTVETALLSMEILVAAVLRLSLPRMEKTPLTSLLLPEVVEVEVQITLVTPSTTQQHLHRVAPTHLPTVSLTDLMEPIMVTTVLAGPEVADLMAVQQVGLLLLTHVALETIMAD